MKICLLLLLILFCACTPKPSNAIDELAEHVIDKKEGVDIKVTPIEEER